MRQREEDKMPVVQEALSEFEKTERYANSGFGNMESQLSMVGNEGRIPPPVIEEEPIDEEEMDKRKAQVNQLEKYIYETGLKLSFQIIFTEIVEKGIIEEDVFKYTAQRLRQIGHSLASATIPEEEEKEVNEKKSKKSEKEKGKDDDKQSKMSKQVDKQADEGKKEKKAKAKK